MKERNHAEESRRKVIIATCIAFVVGGLSVIAIVAQLNGLWERYYKAYRQQQEHQPATAAAFYEAGVQFKRQGWVEKSRAALQMAISKNDDGTGRVKTEAERFLRTRLPAKSVSSEAERQNIMAYNAEAVGNTREAKRIWLQMTETYPDFEWPYGNLASVYLDEGDAATARQLADKVLAKNPHYLNGIMVLAKAQMASGDKASSEATLKRALEENPDDYEAKMLYRRVTAGQQRSHPR